MFSHGITTGRSSWRSAGVDRTTAGRSATTADFRRRCRALRRFSACFRSPPSACPARPNFVGEFLVLVGASLRSFTKVLLAMAGIVLAAALYAVDAATCDARCSRRHARISVLPDLSVRETVVLAPLAGLILGIGVFRARWLRPSRSSVAAIVRRMSTDAATAQRQNPATGTPALRPGRRSTQAEGRLRGAGAYGGRPTATRARARRRREERIRGQPRTKVSARQSAPARSPRGLASQTKQPAVVFHGLGAVPGDCTRERDRDVCQGVGRRPARRDAGLSPSSTLAAFDAAGHHVDRVGSIGDEGAAVGADRAVEEARDERQIVGAYRTNRCRLGD